MQNTISGMTFLLYETVVLPVVLQRWFMSLGNVRALLCQVLYKTSLASIRTFVTLSHNNPSHNSLPSTHDHSWGVIFLSMGIHLTSGASFRSGSLLCKHLHVHRESHLNLTVSGDRDSLGSCTSSISLSALYRNVRCLRMPSIRGLRDECLLPAKGMSSWKANTYFRETHSLVRQTSLSLVTPNACPAFSKSNYSIKWELKARTLTKLSLVPVVVWPLVPLRPPLIFVPRSSGYMDWFSLLSSWILLCFASCWLWFAFFCREFILRRGQTQKRSRKK